MIHPLLRCAGLLACFVNLSNAGEAPAAPATPAPGLPSTVSDGAKLELVYQEDRTFFEGPSWDPATKKLYFTAFLKKQSSQILRLDAPGKATVWMADGKGINGTFLAKDGRLLGAQDDGHCVVSLGIGPDGPLDPKVLYQDAALNQPNDLCQTPNGNIYFTDPQFKTHVSGVYLAMPDGKGKKLLDSMPAPNGIIASLDGKTLYVADSHEKLWRAFPIRDDGTLGEGRVFFNPETANRNDPDGMSIDESGTLYFTGRGGVWAVAPDGKALGLIAVPEFCSNCTFGGEDGKTLYMTCSKKVYALSMKVRGGGWFGK